MTHSLLTRFLFMPNAGFGNPNQYDIPKYTPHPKHGIPESNYVLTGISEFRGDGHNYVIFARPDPRFNDGEIPGFNDGDLINIFEFVYDSVSKLLQLITGRTNVRPNDVLVELDLDACPGLYERAMSLPFISPDTACNDAISIAIASYFSDAAISHRITEVPNKLSMIRRQYPAPLCKRYFFPECTQCETCHRSNDVVSFTSTCETGSKGDSGDDGTEELSHYVKYLHSMIDTITRAHVEKQRR